MVSDGGGGGINEAGGGRGGMMVAVGSRYVLGTIIVEVGKGQ